MSRVRIAPLARLPLAIGAMAFLFLGAVPALSAVGRAQRQHPHAGRHGLHAWTTTSRCLSGAFYRASVANTLTIGLLATLTTTLIAVPLAFAIARLDFPGKLLLIGLAALPLVLPSFVGGLRPRAAARSIRHRHADAQCLGHSVRLDLRHARHRHGLHPHALSLRAAADGCRPQGGRCLGRRGGAEPRLLAGCARFGP